MTLAIEVESADGSFSTIFKRQKVDVDAVGDIKIASVTDILVNKGLTLP